MARVRHMTQTYSKKINAFLGVNEATTGDNRLKDGEALSMLNFRVTDDCTLEVRPKLVTRYAMETAKTYSYNIVNIFEGNISGDQVEAIAMDNKIYIGKAGGTSIVRKSVYEKSGSAIEWCNFFMFGGYLYAICDGVFLRWEYGFNYLMPINQMEEVTGYSPIVITAANAKGAGTELEGLNALTPQFRAQYSPDGESTEYALPTVSDKKGTMPVCPTFVSKVEIDGVEQTSGWYYDYSANTITFDTAPAKGVNTMMVYCGCVDVDDNTAHHATTADYTTSRVLKKADGYLDIGFGISEDIDDISGVAKGGIDYTYNNTDGDSKFIGNAEVIGMYIGTYASSSTTYIYLRVKMPDDYASLASATTYFYTKASDGYFGTKNIKNMKYSVLYNGSTDGRLFLYGDGSNITVYSGLDENGTARADYFPVMNQMAIGSANDPITAMCRHYNALCVYKAHECYRCVYDTQTLADGSVIAGFNIRPVHAEIGSEKWGYVPLVNNSPRTLCDHGVYDWKMSYYTSASNRDERSARKMSERVKDTLKTFDMADCIVVDDNEDNEWYCFCGKKCVVHNYNVDAWYVYEFPCSFTCAAYVSGKIILGGDSGAVYTLLKSGTAAESYWYVDSTGKRAATSTFTPYWESGSMDFNNDAVGKWNMDVYVGLLNVDKNEATLSVKTDRTQLTGITVDADTDAATSTVHKVRMRVKQSAFERLRIEGSPDKRTSIISLVVNYRLGTGGRRV